MKAEDIEVYPTTQLLTGQISHEQYVNSIAEKLFDDSVMAYRIDPLNVIKMIIFAAEKHNFSFDLRELKRIADEIALAHGVVI